MGVVSFKNPVQFSPNLQLFIYIYIFFFIFNFLKFFFFTNFDVHHSKTEQSYYKKVCNS